MDIRTGILWFTTYYNFNRTHTLHPWDNGTCSQGEPHESHAWMRLCMYPPLCRICWYIMPTEHSVLRLALLNYFGKSS